MSASSTDLKDLRIDEIVGLLQKVSPTTLDGLRNEYPAHTRLFKVGQTLGGGIPTVVLLNATSKSFERIVPWGESAIVSCASRLSAARRLELGGSLVAMVGSGACAIFATTLGGDLKTTLTAVIAVLGNICVAASQYYSGTLLGGESSLEAIYMVLLRSMPELRFIQSEVNELLQRDIESIGDQEIRVVIERAQELCKQVYEASKQVR